MNELYFDKSGFCIVSKNTGTLLPCQIGRNKERGLNQLQKDKNVKRFKIMQLFSLSCFYFNLQYELLKFRVIFTVHSIFTPTTLQSMVQLCTINNDTVIVGEVSKILNTTIHYQKLLETMIVGEWD